MVGEEIYHAGQTTGEMKPIVASMANVAASGGYYIAMPCERLFANRGSITGSIGIYGGKPDLSGLYEKIDLGKELFTRGKYAGMLSWVRPFSEDEREKYHSHLKAFYDHFLQLVSDNRSLSIDSVDHLARGRVFTGQEALANGLIDELGGIKAALDYSSTRLGLDKYRIELYPQKRPLFILPGLSLLDQISNIILGNRETANDSSNCLPTLFPDGIYARMPFDLEIK